jgi:class 3 adenylate cyclase
MAVTRALQGELLIKGAERLYDVGIHRSPAIGDCRRHQIIVWRLVGMGGPAVDVTPDPLRARQLPQGVDGLGRQGTEQCVVTAQYEPLGARGAGVGEDRLERQQVGVDVVENGERRHRLVHSTGRPRLPAVKLPDVSYARNGDVSIAYAALGEGPIELVFVGGFVSHLEIAWEAEPVRHFFERLAAFARVIVWDKREQGLSDRLGQPPTLEQGMDDLAAVMAATGCERATLFGISEGGPMAAMFAATYPERVSRLILYGTYARMTRAEDHPAGVPRERLGRWIEGVKAGWGGPVALELFAPSAAGDDDLKAWWGHLLRSGTSPRAAGALMQMYLDIDVRPVLGAITAPTLLIHRAEDRLIPVAQGRALAALMPEARYVEVAGEDHVAFLGDSDAILDEVEEFVTGSRREREPERMLATVLFTDIVGSTERAAAAGDSDWRQLLERHDQLVRRELDRHRGREIKQMGDGFLAVFDGPGRAVRCAAAISHRLRPLGIEVRAGVHTGECELRGGDVAGMAVHIGARIGAQARSGEVLVSSTVKDLVVGSELRFEERGATELKGVPGEWHLFALADETLSANADPS